MSDIFTHNWKRCSKLILDWSGQDVVVAKLCRLGAASINWRASEVSETLSGLCEAHLLDSRSPSGGGGRSESKTAFNRDSRYVC